MARKNMNPLALETVRVQDGNFSLDIPRETLKQLAPVGATGNAIVLVDAGTKVSIVHNATDPALNDGKPLDMPFNYTVTLRITREPLDAGERDRVAAIAATQKLEKDRRTKDDQQRREREVATAVAFQREAIEHGMAISAAKNPENDLAQTINKIIGEKVKSALGA